MVNNNNIEVVENCGYLDSQLCNEGGSEADMKRAEAHSSCRSNISPIMGKGFETT